MTKQHIALFLPSLEGGGAERVMVNLARGFVEAGQRVDLVLVKAQGAYLEQVPAQVNIVDLEAGRVVFSLFRLASYLRQAQPDALLAAMDHANVIAIIARLIAHVPTRIVVSVHSTLSIEVQKARNWRGRILPAFIARLYPRAQAIIAVSSGVAEDLAAVTGVPLQKIQVIYNPVVTAELLRKSNAELAHAWFASGQPPVMLAVGRLSEQKDFTTLIRAFALVRKQRPCRLIILGEGEQRNKLENLIAELDLQEDCALPGFVENPYAYMRRADIFVLSSAWEGLVTVLIEAMACGTPVVSTDCPSGSSEILAAGKYGRLVPVGDYVALSGAVLESLDEKADSALVMQRAGDFSQQASVRQYLALLTGAE